MERFKPLVEDGEAHCSEEDCEAYTYYDGPRCQHICGGEVMWLEPNEPTGHYPCWPWYRERYFEMKTAIASIEQAARSRGWSEEVNTPPWSWLVDKLIDAEECTKELMNEIIKQINDDTPPAGGADPATKNVVFEEGG